MAMTVMNNPSAMLTLGQLNKNISKAGKDLKKVASGMKINGAGDDTSGYSISKKMETMIRSLGQDTQNTVTGRNLVAVAEGAQQEIVNNLRSMKRMALDAANDTNTDADRATINKEFEKRKETITDIAATTEYNGKILLDGRYCTVYDPSQTHFSSCFFGYSPNCINSSDLTSGSPITFPDGTLQSVTGEVAYKGDGSSYTSWSDSPTTGNASYSRGPFGVSVDLSSIKVDGIMPIGIHGTGFSILCGGCDQFINFRFDATSSETTLNGTNNPAVADTINHQNMTYSIGIQGVTSLDELTEVMYLGIKSLRSVPSNAIQDADVVSIDTHHELNISKIGDDIVFTKDDDWLSLIVYDHLIGDNPDFRESRPLTIHTGPKANQALKLNFNDMRSSAMLLDTVTVTNRDNANAAIGACDAAIEYALNEVTRSGAYRARLEFTEENLVTANENTQASESTIRDADMAKEMTEYTRSNVLAQASQSMLAQANQNASSVLSLLQ